MTVHLRSGRKISSTDWATWKPEDVAAFAAALLGNPVDLMIPGYVHGIAERPAHFLIRVAEVEFFEFTSAEVQLIDQETEKKKASLKSITAPPENSGSGDPPADGPE